METIFGDILKSNDIVKIIDYISKNEYEKQKIVDTIINNLCFLNIKNITELIVLMNLKSNSGSRKNLYVKSTECSENVFGFINSYFSASNSLRYDAYLAAVKNNRVDILKKIRDISPKNLKKIYQYIHSSSKILKSTKDFVKKDLHKSSSKKDTSPEDMLKSILKLKINLKM